MMNKTLNQPPRDTDDDEIAGLLNHALADADAAADAELQGADATRTAVRDRLRSRLAASRAAEAAMVTTRLRRAAPQVLAEGVAQRLLYAAPGGFASRGGEPLRARLFELAPGAVLHAGLLGSPGGRGAARPLHREWLVLRGELALHGPGVAAGEPVLGPRDYHVTPDGRATPTWTARGAALLFLRESELAAEPGDAPFTLRDAQAGWPAYAPGIDRRVLWQRGGQAALLYRADPGVSVPHHTHGHDEDCLMVGGELFLDDVLLQEGDYQLAPVGTGHHLTHTDVGAVIYAHGDLDLRFVDAAK